VLEHGLPNVFGLPTLPRVNGDWDLQFPRQRKCSGMRRGGEPVLVAGQINAADTVVAILVRELHRFDVLLRRDRAVATKDQSAPHAKVPLPAAESLQRGNDRVLGRESFVAGQGGRKPRLEENDKGSHLTIKQLA
jgi:hypothetical protein